MTKMVQMEVPQKVHWRIFMDLADYAKRDSRFETAIHLYRIVVSMQPYAHQGWLEYAKMEEECGNQDGCRDILKKGIQFSPLNENLFLKLVRIEERRNDVASVRKMTKYAHDAVQRGKSTINDVWKLLVESALAEGRCGHRESARKGFAYLMKHLPGNGNVFLEASRFEEREGQLLAAIGICERGLDANTKFSPLWFQYLKLYEKASDDVRAAKFDRQHTLVRDLFKYISKDYHWKLQIELAQTFQRLGNQEKCHAYLRAATNESPDCAKWKIWLVAARILLADEQYESGRLAIERACMEVPLK